MYNDGKSVPKVKEHELMFSQMREVDSELEDKRIKEHFMDRIHAAF